MNIRWAVSLPLSHSLAAGPLRLREDLDALVDADSGTLWIRGSGDPQLERDLDTMLKVLPELQRFSVSKDGQLFPVGRRLPHGLLPKGSWQSLDSILSLESQAAAFAGESPSKIALRLVRSTSPKDCQAMLCPVEDLFEFVKSTAQCRLTPLHFAVNAERQALVLGHPLPPLLGPRFVLAGSVAYPAGFELRPQLDEITLQIALNLVPGDLALFFEDGHYEIIGEKDRIPVNRRSVLASLGDQP